MDDLPLVFQNNDLVVHAIDEHTWVGNGNMVYNESIYIVEGEKKFGGMTKGTVLDRVVTAEGVRFNYSKKNVK